MVRMIEGCVCKSEVVVAQLCRLLCNGRLRWSTCGSSQVLIVAMQGILCGGLEIRLEATRICCIQI